MQDIKGRNDEFILFCVFLMHNEYVKREQSTQLKKLTMKHFLALVTLFLLCISYADGVECYSCGVMSAIGLCYTKTTCNLLEVCYKGQSGSVVTSKGCLAPTSCEQSAQETAMGIPYTVVRHCCLGNLCNGEVTNGGVTIQMSLLTGLAMLLAWILHF
ncbi:sperm acrosome membrane-associated protein 4-like [Protopterus annectens]|uniref:sperm acrosome membrane-associated protein 4-like n=1 Tax=Protopterus annectens TaxID=7888 RepID=UPI001CFA6739|nr:sperm acrosome membrane-associated protein 4-like [Protopterus annectens]